MKRSAAVFVCLALLLALPQTSWRHIHAHGHDGHHAESAGAFHAHLSSAGDELAWRAHGPDEDARALGGPLATSRVVDAGSAATLTASVVLHAPPPQLVESPDLVSSGTDPPRVSRSGPRAPPA